MKPSASGEMNKDDWKKWALNTVIFSIPALLAFLSALQTGGDFKFALGAGYSALIGSIIDFIKKYQAGK